MKSLREYVQRLFGWFVSGLVILLPLGATMILLGWALDFLDGLIGGQSIFATVWRSIFGLFQFGEAASLLLGYFFLFVVIVAVGYFARGFAKQQMVNLLRDFFGRIPFINKIYHSVEQVVDLWSKKKEGGQISQMGEVVVVQFMNTKALGILSSQIPYVIEGEKYYLVYLPSSPVPATGFNYFFKADDVSFSDMKIDEMTKVIVSLGVLGHEVLGDEISLRNTVSP